MLIRRAELLCLLLNLLWTPSPGLAHNGCSGFGHLENGRMFFRYGGLYVTFTCNPGFRIYGYRTSSCVSGQWARKPPLCVASGCPTPGHLLHGSIAMSQDRSLAFFSCDAGFSLVGSALLYCKGNSWNGTKPVCKVSDIMSVLHLKEESLDDPVLALRLEASSRLKDLLHSHLNSIAITAPKDTFLKSALLGVSHAKSDFIGKKESIRKPPLKRPSFEFSEADILKEPINLESSIDPIRNTGADVLKEPISLENSKDPIRNTGADVPKEPISLENSKDPIRNTGADVLKEPFSLENSTDPIRNKDFLKLTAAFTDSTTISLTSTFNESLLRTATMPTNFITPVTDRPVEGSTTKIMGQTLTKTPYRGNERNHQSTFATDKPFQSIPVVSTFQTSPLYAEMNSHWTSTTSAQNINTPGTNVLPTDHFKSVTFTTKSPFEGTTGFVFQELTKTIIKSNDPGKVGSNGKLQSQFHEISKFDHTSESPGKPTSSVGYMESEHNSVSSTSFLDSSAYNTVPSLCGGFCDQKPELLETSPPPRPSKHTSTSMEILTMSTQQVSGLPLKTPDVHLIRNHTYNVQNNSSTLPTRSSFIHEILRNGTPLKIIDNQVNKRSNQSNLKQTLDPPTRQHLEITSSTIARLPTRKHRPVCSYPPLPSHGTFYFRAMKNPGPLQYKHYIQYACYPGYTLTNGDVYSYCQHNGQWSGVTPLCLELTPCSINNGGCSQICQVNDQHRAQCLCKPGFLLLEDQRTCRDLDECVEELHSCQQVCENTLGSYRCSCGPGFQLSSDGTSCSDVDECLHTVGLSVCVFGCINTPGSFQCLCPDGYTLDSTNRHCVDIDECVENVGPGTCTGACQNTLGSFRCTCEPGFQLAGDGRECVPECPPGFRKLHNSPGNSSDERCVDINECEESQVFREKRMHRCEWRCVNLPGTHRCICPRGYRLQFNGHQCEDVNECELKNGICSHICINHRGGYRCACPETHRISPYNPKNCQPIYTQTDSSH